MKHILCVTFIALLVVHYVQAAEVPFIELKGHTDFVRSIKFSHEGKRIITISDTETCVWNAETGENLFTFPGGQFHLPPNEKRIVTQSDSETHIWDAESGKKMFALPGGSDRVRFSPNEKKIMTSQDHNGPYHIWDAESGKELYVLTSQSDRWSGFSPTFTTDSKKIRMVDGVGGITGNDSKIRFFDAETGKELELPARHNSFSPDGKKMFSWSDRSEVRIWDDDTGKELFVLPGTFGGFSPNGKSVITRNEGNTHIWDAETGKELCVLPGTFGGFSPNGKSVITWNEGNTHIWDAESGEELFTSNGRTMRFSYHKRMFATWSADEPVRVWDTESCKELCTLTGVYVTFAGGGEKNIITWSNNETHIWDAESGKEVSVLPARCSSLGFSPDGKKIVAFGFPDGMTIYDVESRKALYSVPGRFDRFLPGGKAIVTFITVDAETDMSYEVEHVWNAETGRAIVLTGTFTGFSPDGNKIVSVNDNKTHVWDTESGKELHVFSGTSRGFTPDGRLMTTLRYGSRNDTIRIWDISAIMGDNQ